MPIGYPTIGIDPLSGIDLSSLGNMTSQNNPFTAGYAPYWSVQPTWMLGQGVQNVQGLLPNLTNAITSTYGPATQAGLQASAQNSPGYYNLLTNLMSAYGPALSQAGTQTLGANIGGNIQNLAGGGSTLLGLIQGLNQALNPQQFQAIQQGGKGLSDLLGSINVNGGLSGSERNEIAQGLAREGLQRGSYNAPSASDTVANAMQYGQAGYQRRLGQQNLLADAITKSASFIPAANTGFNPTNIQGIGSGAASVNPGSGMFSGVQAPDTSTGTNAFNQLFGQYGSLANTGASNAANVYNTQQATEKQIQANKKDWMDYLVQGSQVIGNIAGGVMGAGCWVAREVYGINNPKWLRFRHWMFGYSPRWFFNFYIRHGRSIAKFICNKPLLKSIIRNWMDTKI